MSTHTQEAYNFVQGIASYLRADGGHASAVGKVRTLLTKVTAKARRGKVATVESSVVLTQKERQAIERLLSRLMDHAITLDCRLNHDLLGGLRIGVGDWVVDTTMRAQIDDLAAQLI